MRLGNDLYGYLWRDSYENNCNTYLIGGEKKVLVDPGHARHLHRLFEQMNEDGISPDDIDLLIATHGHPDHLEGLQGFSDGPHKVAMSRKEEAHLLGEGRLLFEMMGLSPPQARVDFYLKEGELRIGEKSLRVYETPGHSPGSLSIYWPERKVLITGDLIFLGGIGRTDFPGGDPVALKESIERLSALETEIMLPGHGDIISGKEAVVENFEFIRRNLYAYL